MSSDNLRKFVKKCKKSVTYFIESCIKIEHPSIGIIPFQLFSYQKHSLKNFRQHRFNIFLKCRQSGISTLTSAYCLWFAMFFCNKKVLIVSKRDLDAKDFLAKIKFAYNNLPQWMKDLWPATTWNEHEIGFNNGSMIRSLTSSIDTLRSNASSLNIIDESAFMADMTNMWAGGWSTMQHGGSAIIISTPNGIGNWYWEQWQEAEAGTGIFNPIRINWWDMDWVLEFDDPISKKKKRIAPTDDIRKCKGKDELDRYGPYWSPWLENEYRGLKSKGEAHLFKQEVLAEFLGGGGTVLAPSTIRWVREEISKAPEPQVVTDQVNWVNNATGQHEYIDLGGNEPNEGLWIWKKPMLGTKPTILNGRVTDPGEPGHMYVMGVDIATGENMDYSAIQVFDIQTMEQVAEYMGRVKAEEFSRICDWVGRWYNNALMNIERTGIGIPFIQSMQNLIYPNLWRKRERTVGGWTTKPWGFATTGASKPTLNKALIQYIDEEGGYSLKSSRIASQLEIYIRKRDRTGRDTKKTGAQEGRGNHDDLVMAAALAFIAVPDVVDNSPAGMLPARNTGESPTLKAYKPNEKWQQQKKLAQSRLDPNVLVPMTGGNMDNIVVSPQEQLENFANQIISPISQPKATTTRKHGF